MADRKGGDVMKKISVRQKGPVKLTSASSLYGTWPFC
jgi:hypothetical protein